MPLSDHHIAMFEQALGGPAPPWDSDWRISKTLLELVRVQADRILTLEEQLQAAAFSQSAAIASLAGAIRGGLQAQVNPRGLNDAQVAAAVADLKRATEAAQRGEAVARYAGAVLKFVAKLVL